MDAPRRCILCCCRVLSVGFVVAMVHPAALPFLMFLFLIPSLRAAQHQGAERQQQAAQRGGRVGAPGGLECVTAQHRASGATSGTRCNALAGCHLSLFRVESAADSSSVRASTCPSAWSWLLRMRTILFRGTLLSPRPAAVHQGRAAGNRGAWSEAAGCIQRGCWWGGRGRACTCGLIHVRDGRSKLVSKVGEGCSNLLGALIQPVPLPAQTHQARHSACARGACCSAQLPGPIRWSRALVKPPAAFWGSSCRTPVQQPTLGNQVTILFRRKKQKS